MKRGDVWWVCFDPSVGTEIQKTRPAVIVSNDYANAALDRLVVIPLTSNTSRVYPGECIVNTGLKLGKAMSDQITAVDKSRVKGYMGTLSAEDMLKVDEALRLHLGLELY